MPRAPTGVSGSGSSTAAHCHVRSARPESSAVCSDGTAWRAARRSAGRRPTSGRWHGRCPGSNGRGSGRPAAAGWMTVPTSATQRKSTMLVHAGFDVHLDFSKRRDEGQRVAVARVRVACHAHQALPGKRRGRPLGKGIDVLGHLVAVVDASELDRALARPSRASCRRRRPCATRARWPRRSLRAGRRDPSRRSAAAS